MRARIVSGRSSERWYSSEPSRSQTPADVRRAEQLVVRVARRATDPAAGHPADQLLGRDVDEHGHADRGVALAEGRVERPRLDIGPREAVEDHPAAGVGAGEPVEQQAHGDLVGHELAGVHVAARLDAQRGAIADRGPEQVAGGDDRDPEPVARSGACVPFPAPGAPSRITTSMSAERPSVSADAAWTPGGRASFDEAFVLADEQLGLDLLHRLDDDGDHDQDAGATEGDVLESAG